MNLRLLAASAVFALAASACGNSGSSSVPSARTGANPAPAATSSPNAGTAASAQRSTMTISISIPSKTKTSAHRRRPKTVSSGTTYVDVVLQSLNGEPQPASGPYTVLVPVSQLGACPTHSGRGHNRAVQSASGCFTVSVPAPVGNDVYAVGALDGSMTLLDYVENVPVTVGSSGTASLVATLNGVGAEVIGSTMLADPANVTPYRAQYGVDCPASAVQYDAKAVCSFVFDVADGSGDDMAVGNAALSQAYLANALAFTATDITTQQPLDIAYDTASPNAAAPINEIDFDPATWPGGAVSGVTLNAGRLGRYNAVIHPDLGEIPPNATDVVEFKAVLSPPATTAFGPSVLLPNTGPVTFTWDLSCKNVTVGPNDPSGLAEGSVLQFCEPQESSFHLVVQ
jgi:hypothetical protein